MKFRKESTFINNVKSVRYFNRLTRLKKYFDGTVEVQIRDKEYGNWRFYQEFPTMAKAKEHLNKEIQWLGVVMFLLDLIKEY